MTGQIPVVELLETGTARLPLPVPLQLGSARIERREYAAVRLRSSDGLIGRSYCLTREAPMAEIVERMLAASLVGSPADSVEQTWDRLLRASATVGRVGLVRRAIGLLDIALWDIVAQRAGAPVWKALGQSGEPRPTILVACYPTPGRTVDELVAEIVAAAAEGWSYLKISRSPDTSLMRDLLRELGAALPANVGVVVDVGFGWRDSDEALRELDEWGAPALAWLEDPLLPEDAAGCAAIRKHGGHKVGVGDEVTDPDVLVRLMDSDAVDLLRVDVVALGGITPTREMIAMAGDRGIPVSCHIYPEVSVHLGAITETFSRTGAAADRYDPSARLVRGGPSFVGGRTTPNEQPGLGFDLDWEAFGLARSS